MEVGDYVHILRYASDGLMTRHLKLENCKTGTVDLCFDFSMLKHDNQNDFSFMKIGEIYDCKILLFGNAFDLSDHTTQNSIVCETVKQNFSIGKLEVVQISNNKDTYFVAADDIRNLKDLSQFAFDFSRKDLIQVNDIIHPTYL